MSKWDKESVSDSFMTIANNTERYVNEVKEKMWYNKLYEPVFDEHLAKFYVYNSLWGKLCLASREHLLQELDAMLKNPVGSPEEACDKSRFKIWREKYVKQLIDEFGGYFPNITP